MAIFVLDISNSQLLFNERVAEELAAAGHDVTMILMTPQDDRDNTDIRIKSRIKGEWCSPFQGLDASLRLSRVNELTPLPTTGKFV
ncbi:hypothetical protein Y032_0027g1498 [Ancylostoma ceylanicum]|uniref:Uncharacterized protein n=1 Tax=Ancylostoma ceylanicum TaxID=53326 RepID=A0A016UTW4_9BILA|nr:hypothetical protein Y032_0027g1498 [Ancylostoma ceylanicum]